MGEQIHNRSWKIQALRRLLLVLVCAWLMWFVYRHRQEFQFPPGLTVTTLMALYGGFLVQMACFAGMFRVMLKRVGADCPLMECFQLTLGSSLLNMVLPARAGAAYRAAFLRSRYQVSLTDFLATLASFYLLSLATHSLAGLIASVAMLAEGEPVPRLLIGVLAGGFCLSSYLIFGRRVAALASSETVPALFRNIACRALRFRTHLAPILPLLVFAVTSAAVSYWQTAWLFSAVSVEGTWAGTVLYSATRVISMLVPLTPGSLGIAEGAAVYLGQTLGYSDVTGITMQALTRAVAMSSLVLFGTPSLLWLRFRSVSGGMCVPVSSTTLPE